MTIWEDEQYNPSGIDGMTIGELFEKTYGPQGLDPAEVWRQQNAANNPPVTTPTVAGTQGVIPHTTTGTPASGGGGGGGGTSGGGLDMSIAAQIDRALQKLTATYEARDAENTRRWDIQQGNWQQQFGLQQRQFDTQRQQFQDQLAQALLGTSASLRQALLGTSASMRGPRDYAAFQKYTSGGRNLLDTLRGGQSRPAFSAPTGPLEPQTIESVMARLRGEGGGGGDVGAGGIPLPFQISPAVWDSLGPVGQQLLLGLAEQAGWDADEFMRQLNAARPQGSAAGPVRFSYRR